MRFVTPRVSEAMTCTRSMRLTLTRGRLAPMVEQLLCTEKVRGSTPRLSTSDVLLCVEGCDGYLRGGETQDRVSPVAKQHVAYGLLAQSGRALRSQRRGRAFKSRGVHEQGTLLGFMGPLKLPRPC